MTVMPQRRGRAIDEPVTISKIYTRHGDGGQTKLADGSRVSKASARVEAYGAVDELNAALGLALCVRGLPQTVRLALTRVQNELFDLGADLAVPADDERGRLRVEPAQVRWLEEQCDALNADLPRLRSFVLPGGSEPAARLHVARTACRRAERRAVALAELEPVSAAAIVYLNRLSDLLFIMARFVTLRSGMREPLWRPGLTTAARTSAEPGG